MSDKPELGKLREPSEIGQSPPSEIPLAKVVAIGIVIGVIIVVVWVLRFMAEAPDLSAIQVMQIYIQAGFWVLVAIALLLAGLLVRS